MTSEMAEAVSPPSFIPPEASSKPKSYANAVNNKPSLTQFNVPVEVINGKSKVKVPEDFNDEEVPLWEDFLAGHFPSNAAPHVGKIHVIVNKIWNFGDKSIQIDVQRVNNSTVKFCIRNEAVRSYVLRRGMWNICALPMMVSKWSPIAEEAQAELQTMPMWVVMKNVPHSMFHWKGLSYIASPVGVPKRLHPDTVMVTSFDDAKVFVEVNLKQELPTTFYYEIKGEEFCVNYEYPWLPPKCVTCHKWGHSEERCLANMGKRQEKKSQETAQQSPKLQEEVVRETSEIRITSESVPTQENISLNLEVEEGEITIPQENSLEPTEERGWTTVSGGKKASPTKELKFGQVSILAPSRFSVLNDQAEDSPLETESVVVPAPESNNQTEKEPIENQYKTQETTLPTSIRRSALDVEKTYARKSLHRQSKNAHNAHSDSTTQRAKDSIPSTSTKRNTRKHH